MRPVYSIAAVALVLILGSGWAYNHSQPDAVSGRNFSDADVAKVEQSIKTEFARRSGLIVQEVKMTRESPGRLTGVAKFKVPQLGSFERTCDATLGERGQPIWQCK
jgi:hypothetical protein